MKNKHALKLIEGKFTPEEAGKVLFELLSNKINYHEMERFSNQERFGKDLSNSKSRIEQLYEVRGSLEKILQYSSERGLQLNIECFIDIIFTEAIN